MFMKKYKRVTFEFKTITPMFLGGADAKKPEIRVPSIKGALRFWWRAMNAHLVEKKNDKWDYSKLKEYENAIFGGTDPKAQKSKVLLRIVNIKPSEPNKEAQDKTKEKITYDTKKRNFLEGSWDLLCEYPEGIIIAEIQKEKIEINVERELQIAFSMLNLFGTLGSKARNGFGSIQISSSEDFTLLSIDKIQEYLQQNELQKYLQQKKHNKPSNLVEGVVPYTAFADLQVIMEGTAETPIEALEKIAINYRGAKKQVKQVKSDNQMIAAPENTQISAKRYPKRYWFSVKKIQNDEFKWQCLYLPMCIEFNSENKNNYSQKYKEQNQEFQKALKDEKK